MKFVSTIALLLIAPFAGLLEPLQASSRPSGLTEKNQTRLLTREFLVCVIRRRPAEAQAVLLSRLDNAEIIERYPKLLEATCMPGRVRGSGLQLILVGDEVRYGLADALIMQEYYTALPTNIGLAAPLVHRELPVDETQIRKTKEFRKKGEAVIEDARRSAKASRILSEFGECAVRSNPPAAHRFLLTEPESADESQAFQAVKSFIGPCLVQWQLLQTDLPKLRGTMAYNFYRLAHSTPIARESGVIK